MAHDQRRPPGSVPPTPGRGDTDPLVDLARLIGDDDRASHNGGHGEEPEFDFGNDPAAYGAAAREEDSPYPPEAYAGLPYDGGDGDADLPPRRHGGMVAVAAALAVVVLGVGGVLAYHELRNGERASAGGAPPVIRASTEPTKIIPEQASPAKPPGAKLAYDGVTTDTTGKAHVVGGPEEPMERPVPQHAPVQAEDAAPSGPTQDIATTSRPAPGDGSRQVTTITIQPAGGLKPPTDMLPLATENPTAPGAASVPVVSITPVEGHSPAAKATAAKSDAPAPVVLPSTPDQTGKPVVGTGVAAGMTLMPGSGFGIMQDGTGKTDTAQGPAASAPMPQPAPQPGSASDTASAASARPVPLPEARPSGLHLAAVTPTEPQPINRAPVQVNPAPAHVDRRPVGAPVRLSPLPLTPTAQQAASVSASHPAASAGGGYMIQLTSRRTQTEAVDSFHQLQRRYPQLLGSYSAEIQPAALADRGTFYRVRIGQFGAEQATSLCKQLKAAGGSCIVQRQ